MEKAADNDLRYERKFVTTELSPTEIELTLKLHPVLFREIYYPRHVNNIYFDSEEMDSYYENVGGIADRKKIRVRWYGELYQDVETPFLEFKHKRSAVGFKERFKLQSFRFDKSFSPSVIQSCLRDSEVPHHALSNQRPVLVNRYYRKYFLSACNRFRITIDSELEAGTVSVAARTGLHRLSRDSKCVIELKYDRQWDNSAPKISSSMFERINKSSKYVSGVDALGIL